MLLRYRVFLALSLGLTLSACGSDKDPDADVMGDTRAAQTDENAAKSAAPAVPQVAMPVEVSNDAISLGTTANGNRVSRAARPSFRISDTVYAGIAGGHPPGAEARIYWTNQKSGLSDKEETKTVSDEGVVFTFNKASGMKPGRYTVQVDVAEKPIGLVDFEVK